jgi:ankyrin repeat protein
MIGALMIENEIMLTNKKIHLKIAAVCILLTFGLSSFWIARNHLIRGEWGFDRLIEAIQTNDLQAVRHLVNAGVNLEGYYSLDGNILHPKTDVEKLGATPLMLAASSDKPVRLEIVRFLLDKGANVNAHDKDGSTALHDAARKGATAVAMLLIDHGAVIEPKGTVCPTPIGFAEAWKHHETARAIAKRNK